MGEVARVSDLFTKNPNLKKQQKTNFFFLGGGGWGGRGWGAGVTEFFYYESNLEKKFDPCDLDLQPTLKKCFKSHFSSLWTTTVQNHFEIHA